MRDLEQCERRSAGYRETDLKVWRKKIKKYEVEGLKQTHTKGYILHTYA